ncbi:hypothetical protein P5G65_20400 [Paenibacillus chondroitinus]|uniref:Uncharacterized protein n=1 Tax=Paenibacillus chondroitinus TaxID=59842 RepID=A0ABU6DET8_9BACL|nr:MULTISPECIES: hypothetical protein [Paenibacillus]MCY9661503.1 hypothetical protein [Paenibacillus anseongense]MEB4796271.1 hypothetical protein [Paenibacillus chondroitinus]
MGWLWLLHIPFTACILFSMLMLGLHTFRISVNKKWPLVLIFTLVISCLVELFTFLVDTKSWSPMLAIVLEAICVHYVLRLRKLHALMIVLLGAVGYTIYLFIVLIGVALVTDVPVYDYFDNLDSWYRPLKIYAALLACLTALLLNKNRLGFTMRLERNDAKHANQAWRPRNHVLFPALLTAFILYSSAYYGVSMHVASIFYWAAGFCLVLAWMIYLLYRKEMEEQ